jgi:hypothetical protein
MHSPQKFHRTRSIPQSLPIRSWVDLHHDYEQFLDGISFPALPKLLLFTDDIVTLGLLDIPLSGYISLEAIVTCLSALTKLQALRLGFPCPRSRDDRENRLLSRLTRIVLPALTYFYFKGDGECMEDIVGQIDTLLLHQFDITFFNRLVFDTPLLCDFIGRIEAFKTPHRADIDIRSSDIRVRLFRRDWNNYRRTLSLAISCRPLDWQLSSLAQLFNSALSHLLTFEYLKINYFREDWPDDTEETTWRVGAFVVQVMMMAIISDTKKVRNWYHNYPTV